MKNFLDKMKMSNNIFFLIVTSFLMSSISVVSQFEVLNKHRKRKSTVPVDAQEISTVQKRNPPYDFYYVSDKVYKTVLSNYGLLLSLRNVMSYDSRGGAAERFNEMSLMGTKLNPITSTNDIDKLDLNRYSTNINRVKVYQNNNPLICQNTLYFYSKEKTGIAVYESFITNYEKRIHRDFFNYEFEYSNKGNIDSYSIQKFVLAPKIIALKANSKFNDVSELFVVAPHHRRNFFRLNLSEISPYFDESNIFSGTIETSQGAKKYTTSWGLKAVFRHENLITVFLTLRDNVIIPIQLDEKTMKQKLITKSIFTGIEYDDVSVRTKFNQSIYYLPFSGGFVNCYLDKINYGNEDKNYMLNLYDKNVKFLKSKKINQFYKINHIAEFKDYLIIGGYTKTKGYRGYPNPIVQVIRKSTMEITQTIVLPQKNGVIDCIGYATGWQYEHSDDILIDVSSPSSLSRDLERSERKSKLIIDKINKDGVFTNNLFVK